MTNEFIDYLRNEGKSDNTISNYVLQVKEYLKWYDESFAKPFYKLIRENILEYKSYLKNNRRNNKDVVGDSPRVINVKLSALSKFNEFLVDASVQDDIVITKKDFYKIASQQVNPAKVTHEQIKRFRQLIIENENMRNRTIINLLYFTPLRISECLNLRKRDVNLKSGEIRVDEGKGQKARIVSMPDVLIDLIKEYVESIDTEYLFMSQKGNVLDRTVVNRLFTKYSKKLGDDIKVSPHDFRHNWCTVAAESGEYTVSEIASEAGHSNIQTTMIYMNPTRKKLREKSNRMFR